MAAAAVWPDRYLTLAALADLLRAGGPGLRRQPSRAAELYEEAAEAASEVGKSQSCMVHHDDADTLGTLLRL